MVHHGQIRIEQSTMDVVIVTHDVIQVMHDEVRHLVQQQVHHQYHHIQLRIMHETQQHVQREQQVYMWIRQRQAVQIVEMDHHGRKQIEQSIMDVAMESHDVIQVMHDEVKRLVQQPKHHQ